MRTNDTIYNVTRGYPMRAKRVLRGIDNCAMAWVEYGKSVRDLTWKDAIAARNEQAKKRGPLAYAEVPGLRFDPPASGEAATWRERRRVWEAHQFYKEICTKTQEERNT